MLISIDTSALLCSVALFRENELIYYELCDSEHRQAELLLTMINHALEAGNITYSQLFAMAVAIGPGSFTGLRVGIAAVKGISLVYPHLTTLGISTLESLQYDQNLSSDISVISAGRGMFYVQKFQGKLPTSDIEKLSQMEVESLIGDDFNYTTNAELIGLAALNNLKTCHINLLKPIYF